LLAVALAVGPAASGTTVQSRAVAGSAAWVRVSVATVWYTPESPRRIDAPALAAPAQVGAWLARQTVRERRALGNLMMTQALLGERVVVIAHRPGWSKIRVPSQRGSVFRHGIVGWPPTRQLVDASPPASTQKVIVSVPHTWLYAAAGGSRGQALFQVSYDTVFPLLAKLPGYDVVGLPGGGQGAIAADAARDAGTQPVSGSTIVAEARHFLGLPYLWAGTSGFGYDCSGLVYALFAQDGVILPRDASDQRDAGISVPLKAARPGDLLFFANPGGKGWIHHVAVYAGHGHMIDTPHTGAAVEDVPMRSSRIWKEFAGARRVAPAP